MSREDFETIDLRQIATEKVTKMLQESAKSLDAFISTEIRKQFAKTFSLQESQVKAAPPTSISKKSKSKSKDKENNNQSKVSIVHDNAFVHAANQMMKISNYLIGSDMQSRLDAGAVLNIIKTALDTNNISLVRLVVKDSTTILDFRALSSNYSNSRFRFQKIQDLFDEFSSVNNAILQSNTSNVLMNESEIKNEYFRTEENVCSPNEFDWFSRDRLGKVLTLKEASELFSIIDLANCAPNVKELCMNVRRSTETSPFYGAREMTLLTSVLNKMGQLSTCILRGFCDDKLLKIIGEKATSLKHLDISGSKFVTDAGIKNLFFGNTTENPATYLVRSFVEKSIGLGQMNPLVNTIDFLDYSWTSVTTFARKMVLHIPGAFMFKRSFAISEEDSFAHHVFMRKQKVAFKGKIPSKFEKGVGKFEQKLQVVIGVKGVKTFLKLADIHPWRNCFVHVYSSNEKGKFYGIMTPNEEEQRVHGMVIFQDGNLIETYSVFPFNLNIIGDACPKLQSFRGIATDIWKMNSSLLQELTHIDMFADPLTTRSILESVPNLRKARVRIVRQPLTDDHIIRQLTRFMCCRTLEELWIGPGTFKRPALRIEQVMDDGSNPVLSNLSMHFATEDPPGTRKSISTTKTETYHVAAETIKLAQIDDLVHLSEDCIRVIVQSCQKLKRLGDIASWTGVSELEFNRVCEDLKIQKSNVVLIWENEPFQGTK